jgi:nicotinamide mononucleotide transporter
MSNYEWAGALLGIISVVMLANNMRWGWWVQNASSSAFLVVFFQAQLFILFGLQLFFIGTATWAWWQWSENTAQNQLAVKRLNGQQITIYLAITVITTVGLAQAMRASGTAAPNSEAFVSASSVMAQWLMSRHFIETWVVWLLANILMVVLSWQSDLKLTAALYAVFSILAVLGWKNWRKQTLSAR